MTEERLKVLSDVQDHLEHDDIIYIKSKILETLLSDPDIIEMLDNQELIRQEAIPEDYYGVNIFSFLKIPDTQSTVKNYICFDVNDTEPAYYNNLMVTKQVIFRCASHEQSVFTKYGIDRQDILGYLVKDDFQWHNKCGYQMKKTYDGGRIAENGFYYRELHFQIVMPSGYIQKVKADASHRY